MGSRYVGGKLRKSQKGEIAKLRRDVLKLKELMEDFVRNQESAAGQVKAQYERAKKMLENFGVTD